MLQASLWWALTVLFVVPAFVAASHALLYKRDPRAAWGWIALCIIMPPVGAVLYCFLGVNRVQSKGRRLQKRSPFQLGAGLEAVAGQFRSENADAAVLHTEQSRLVYAMTGRPITSGNEAAILFGGEQAYPLMLQAIEQARESVYIATYIFEANTSGRKFIAALAAAAKRGVDVRVLVDGVGEWHGLPLATSLLHKHGVRTAKFLPPRVFPPSLSMNLRLHHKIMVVDGRVGFTGGMNIGDTYMALDSSNPYRASDVHFQLRGPAVIQLEEIFFWDWGFATGEETYYARSSNEQPGNVLCRTVVDGPNEDLDTLTTLYVAAIMSARRRVDIVTPYFLPPREMIKALQVAARRGLAVRVVLPGTSDSRIVHRATRNMLWEVLEAGVQVYYQPPPFSHAKLFVVDQAYAVVGSSNLDPRSLRLNFELAVEIYDENFATARTRDIDQLRYKSTEITLQEVDSRPLGQRLLDAACWLFSPYL